MIFGDVSDRMAVGNARQLGRMCMLPAMGLCCVAKNGTGTQHLGASYRQVSSVTMRTTDLNACCQDVVETWRVQVHNLCVYTRLEEQDLVAKIHQ